MPYPITGGISKDSTIEFNNDLVADIMVSGKTRFRSMADNLYRIFNVKYDVLTHQQKLDLESFYQSSRATQFSFVWTPYSSTTETYTVSFAEAPRFQAIGGVFWSAEVILIQTVAS